MTKTTSPSRRFTYTPRPVRTCRHCLGNGCIHCDDRGQVRTREFRRTDMEAVRLRRLVFGTIPSGGL